MRISSHVYHQIYTTSRVNTKCVALVSIYFKAETGIFKDNCNKHDTWCLAFLCHQVISNHGIYNSCLTDPCLSRGILKTTSAITGLRNYMTWGYNIMFVLLNSASHGLTDSDVWTCGSPFDYFKPRSAAPVATEWGTLDFLVPESPHGLSIIGR